jgi:hypothetical protein
MPMFGMLLAIISPCCSESPSYDRTLLCFMHRCEYEFLFWIAEGSAAPVHKRSKALIHELSCAFQCRNVFSQEHRIHMLFMACMAPCTLFLLS